MYIYICVCVYMYTYTCTYIWCNNSHKKEWNLDICDNMYDPGGHYAKWNKTEKANTVWYHLYVESNKENKWTNITIQ